MVLFIQWEELVDTIINLRAVLNMHCTSNFLQMGTVSQINKPFIITSVCNVTHLTKLLFPASKELMNIYALLQLVLNIG